MGMTKKLLVVFASGLILSLVLLSSAWVVGGDELTKRMHSGKGWSVTIDTDNSPRATRDLTYDASQSLTISAPVTLRYEKNATASLSVSGPGKTVNAMRWEGGELSLGKGLHIGHDDVIVTIKGPQLPPLVLQSALEAKLRGLDQAMLKIDSRGAVEIDAQGRVDQLEITASGASDIDLADLAAQDAKVTTNGAGNVSIAANGKVEVEVNGAGSVSLKRKPRELISRINGVGSVDNDY